MPHPRVGWGNTGNLTDSGDKFPSTGTKQLVIMSPSQKRGFYRGFDLPIKMIFFVQQTATIKCPRMGKDVDIKSPVGVWGSQGWSVELDIDRCIMQACLPANKCNYQCVS